MKFRHYNNHKIYTLVGQGVHKQTGEATVCYQGEDGRFHFDCYENFFGKVLKDGKLVDRFALIDYKMKI